MRPLLYLLLGALPTSAATLTREGWAITQIDEIRAHDDPITFVATNPIPLNQVIIDFSEILHHDIIISRVSPDTHITARLHGNALECFEEILSLGGYTLRESGNALIVQPLEKDVPHLETHYVHGIRLSRVGDTRPGISAVLDYCRNILRITPDPENEVYDPYGQQIGWQSGHLIGDTRVVYDSEDSSLSVVGTYAQHSDIENLVALLTKESHAFVLRLSNGQTVTLRTRERLRISENPGSVETAELTEWMHQKDNGTWAPRTRIQPALIYPGASLLLWLDEHGDAHLRTETVTALNGSYRKKTAPESIIPLSENSPLQIPLGTVKLNLTLAPQTQQSEPPEDLASLRTDLTRFPN